MCKLNEFMCALEEYAPLELSYKMIEKGDYDNSGIIVQSTNLCKKVLFSLDLSVSAVEFATLNGCDTIVTHHPAIYHPIKRLSINGDTKALIMAVNKSLNVISMHLNLDVAARGIDKCLSDAVGGQNARILDFIDDKHGYGRESVIHGINADEFVKKVKEVLKSDKVLFYGKGKVKKVASFCGGGADHALNAVSGGATDADTVVTSDMPHHVLKELVELDKNVLIIPHYVSEQYGFNKFYEYIKEKLNGKAQVLYYLDKRFM